MTAGRRAAPVVVPCASLDDAIHVFVEQLGWRLDAIWPADEPRRAIVSLGEMSAELRDTTPVAAAGVGGVEGLVVTHLDDASSVVVGRAGMRYRDLLPGRMGGRCIASHIAIPDGGPVPDYVHHHDVDFQVIVCVAGWVRVVYEDQGPAFVLHPGDCVLQAPGIRHRVLEASPGLEVVEVSAPAEHVTHVEHQMTLPNGAVHPSRDFGGQRFVHHVAATAGSHSWRGGPLLAHDTGIADASRGTGSVVRVTAEGAGGAMAWARVEADLLLLYLIGGAATVEHDGGEVALRQSSSAVVGRGRAFRLTSWTSDVEVLEVAVPSLG